SSGESRNLSMRARSDTQTDSRWKRDRLLVDGVDDLGREARELREKLGARVLEPRDARVALLLATRGGVEPLGLEDFDVLGVDARHRRRDQVPEVRILGPLDRPLGDALHDRRRVLDPDLLRALVLLGAADAPGVHQIDLERVLLEQLEEAVALQVV